MAPQPYGPVTKHMQCSSGPDCDQSKFYITEYSTNHGVENFLPEVGKHIGTGYKSNFRPGVYYSKKIDILDNPVVGKLVAENYTSTNRNHFITHENSDGKDTLPKQTEVRKSRFVRDVPRTLPTQDQVERACFYPRRALAPKPRSRLYSLHHKSIDSENNWHGPGYLSTENKAKFLGKPTKLMDTSQKRVGPKEGSGFTHSENNEPITYRPKYCFDVHNPIHFGQMHQTPDTVMKTSFGQHPYSQGKEGCKLLQKRSERNTGYTRDTRPLFNQLVEQCFTKLSSLNENLQKRKAKSDPAEHLNMLHPELYCSTTNATFCGRQANPTPRNLKGGKKQDTGYTDNNCRYIEARETTSSLARFQTNYGHRFNNKNDKYYDRTHVESRPQNGNGFTKSTRAHVLDNKKPLTAEYVHPYVKRSLISKSHFTTPCIAKPIPQSLF